MSNEPTTEKPKGKRTRNVGVIIALCNDNGSTPVPEWPLNVKTQEQAEKLYADLKLTGKVRLYRYLSTIEGQTETVIKRSK